MAPAVLQQALAWQVTFWSGEVTEDEQAGFQRWLIADPAHSRAWAQVQRTDVKLQALTRPAAAGAFLTAGTGSRRRRVLGAAVLLAGIGSAAYAVRQTPQWRIVMASHSTGRGERRDIVLTDGTRVSLGSATAIDVLYGVQARRLSLHAGEIFVATAPDTDASTASAVSGRDFIVETAEGTVRALGTRFSLRQSDSLVQVAVQEGAVEITPTHAGPAGAQRLYAGQQTRFGRRQVESPRPLEPNSTAWTRGLLMAEQMRLEDFLAELSRYRSGVLRSDPAVKDLIVSGVYSLDDTDRVLRTLAQALPVEVRSTTRWWVTVGPRGPTADTNPRRR